MAAVRIPFSRRKLACTLGGLSPVMLLSLASGVSHTLSTSVSGSRAWAAALQAAGAQRLSGIQSAGAARARATLDKLMARLPNLHLSLEETAIVRAVVEFYLGLIVQWMAANRQPRPTRRPSSRRRDVQPYRRFIPVIRAHRTRIGVLLPSAVAL